MSKRKKSRRPAPKPLGPAQAVERDERIAAGLIVPFTREEALIRLLDTSIMLWFHDWDPLSVHMLGSAAHKTLMDINIKSGQEPWLTRIIGYDKLTLAYDWLRHASTDLTRVLDFAPQANVTLLAAAITLFEDTFGHRTTYMSILMFRFVLSLPVANDLQRIAMIELRAKYIPKSVVIEDFAELGRVEFFKKALARFTPPPS